MNTKVIGAEKVDGQVKVKIEGAKGGKEETVSLLTFRKRKNYEVTSFT